MGMKIDQKRTDSKVVKGAVIFAVSYAVKDLFGYTLDSEFIEACIIIAYALYAIFAAYNNPKDKKNF